MILHNLNQIEFLYNHNSKKIYIEESYTNRIHKTYLKKHLFKNYSIEDPDNCKWRVYHPLVKHKSSEQIEFEKLLLERFS